MRTFAAVSRATLICGSTSAWPSLHLATARAWPPSAERAATAAQGMLTVLTRGGEVLTGKWRASRNAVPPTAAAPGTS